MKIKEGFELRDVCGEHVIFNASVNNIDYSKLSILHNDTSVWLFNLLSHNDLTEEQMLDAVCEEYEVERSVAKADIARFCRELADAGIAE